MSQQDTKVLLVGLEEDVVEISRRLSAPLEGIRAITETAADADLPAKADVIVYIVSRRSGYSSRLHLVSVSIHHKIPFQREFLLPLEPVIMEKSCFHELSRIPRTSITDLDKEIQHSPPEQS